MTSDATAEDASAEAVAERLRAEKKERARLRKAAERLGWTWIDRELVGIRHERAVPFGSRTVVVRGRVAVPIPAELTAEAGERAAAVVADPSVAEFRVAMERASVKILSEPDDATETHVFDRPSFFSALDDARRGLIAAYQALENVRVDRKVEAELGLRFYVEGFTTEKRSLEYFVGPTNSGKTHAAIELLRAAQSGVYLAPLRLLALEVYERLNDAGITASLITGEERVIHPSARHVSSTVEMVDLKRSVDVAVVDEAQMLEDQQRGWAWTLAIAGVRAKHVVMCGSEEGLRAARRLAERLGVTLSERRFERKNPLRVVPAVPLAELRAGDAVIGFSRNAVVALQGEIGRLGFSSATIYGSLSPAVRRREAERFRSHAADVLVATDAIGLGLNLPIRRLIFSSIEKFDGVAERVLTPPEIRQIAGRAGRFGIHEAGEVTALDARDVLVLRQTLEHYHDDGTASEGPIWISPTDDHLLRLSAIIGTTRISRLLQFFQTRVLRDADAGLRIADLSGTIEVAVALEMSDAFLELPFNVRCTYSRAPVSTRGPSLNVLARWGEQHASRGFVDGYELTAGGPSRDRLLLFEDRSRLATLYLWLSQRFPDVYRNREQVAAIRDKIDDDIHLALAQRGGRSKKGRAPVPPMRRPARPFTKLPPRRKGRRKF